MGKPRIQDRDFDVAIGARIKKRRQTMGLSQTALARSLGVSFQQVQKYEGGVNRISVSAVVRIAAALGVSTNDILQPENEVPAPVKRRCKAAADTRALLDAFDKIKSPKKRAVTVKLVSIMAHETG